LSSFGLAAEQSDPDSGLTLILPIRINAERIAGRLDRGENRLATKAIYE
jgi:hypothetical protein